jgi:hypothetical protein
MTTTWNVEGAVYNIVDVGCVTILPELDVTPTYAFARHEDCEGAEEDVDDVMEAMLFRKVGIDGIYDIVDDIVETCPRVLNV